MHDKFWKDWIDSGWSGIISECGMGVPIQTAILNNSGASKLLLMGMCPYSTDFQGYEVARKEVRACSSDAVARRATTTLRHDLRYQPRTFSLATSCIHSNPEDYGETHGWACLSRVLENGTIVNSIIHFWLPKKQTRIDAIQDSLKAIKWFLSRIFFGPSDRFAPIGIDVLNGDFSIEEKLSLVHIGNPVVLGPHLAMLRPADVIRETPRIYRGSFNPPHKMHEFVGGNCIWEISRSNVWKTTKADDEDIKHRIEMVLLTGHRVMISAEPYFAVFADTIQSRAISREPITFVVGTDLMNGIVAPEHILSDTFLEPLYAPRSKFVVYTRNGTIPEWVKSKHITKMDVTFIKDDVPNISSSEIRRTRDFGLVSERVKNYIEKENLYAS